MSGSNDADQENDVGMDELFLNLIFLFFFIFVISYGAYSLLDGMFRKLIEHSLNIKGAYADSLMAGSSFVISLYVTVHFKKSLGKNKILENLLFIIMVIFFLSAVYRPIVGFGYFYNSYVSSLIKDGINLLGSKYVLMFPVFVLALLSSFVAFLFRCKRRITYGVIELLFGVISTLLSTTSVVEFLAMGSNISGGDSSDFTQVLFQVIGGIYIIVRGLDNVDQGIYKAKESKAITFVKEIRVSLFGEKN